MNTTTSLNTDILKELKKELYSRYSNGLGIEILDYALDNTDGTAQDLIWELESLTRPDGGTWLIATSDIIKWYADHYFEMDDVMEQLDLSFKLESSTDLVNACFCVVSILANDALDALKKSIR